MFDPIATRIDLALSAMNADPPADTPELDALFAALRGAGNSRQRESAEQRIWAIWCSHEDKAAAAAMQAALDALETGDLSAAGNALDTTIERWPEWAEAWNKRATLRFIEERDADSLDDIASTLQREPRHFGALGGFGQICLRAGDLGSALLVFERVLTIDPGLKDVRQVVDALREQAPHTVH